MEETHLTRNVFIFDEITTENMKEVIENVVDIIDYDNHTEDIIVDYKREPIVIYICSGGGEVLPSIALIELIKNSPTPIATICLGQACSAAFMILISGHARYATKGSSLMFHQMSGGVIGSTKDCNIAIDQMKRLENYALESLKDDTKLPKNMIDEVYKNQVDKYLTVEEAKSFGVIDHIYGEDGNVDNKNDVNDGEEIDKSCDLE